LNGSGFASVTDRTPSNYNLKHLQSKIGHRRIFTWFGAEIYHEGHIHALSLYKGSEREFRGKKVGKPIGFQSTNNCSKGLELSRRLRKQSDSQLKGKKIIYLFTLRTTFSCKSPLRFVSHPLHTTTRIDDLGMRQCRLKAVR
jgi:hypothetical protein